MHPINCLCDECEEQARWEAEMEEAWEAMEEPTGPARALSLTANSLMNDILSVVCCNV